MSISSLLRRFAECEVAGLEFSVWSVTCLGPIREGIPPLEAAIKVSDRGSLALFDIFVDKEVEELFAVVVCLVNWHRMFDCLNWQMDLAKTRSKRCYIFESR